MCASVRCVRRRCVRVCILCEEGCVCVCVSVRLCEENSRVCVSVRLCEESLRVCV